jgi:hypothetical protein
MCAGRQLHNPPKKKDDESEPETKAAGGWFSLGATARRPNARLEKTPG